VSLDSPDIQAPSVPAGLSATAASPTRIDLTWSASTDNVGVKGYTLYRDGTSLGNTASTSFTDTAAAAGTTYSYTVDAFDAAGNRSAKSTATSATTPTPEPTPTPTPEPTPTSTPEPTPTPTPTPVPITFHGSSFAANATATTLSISTPAGAEPGDLEVMAIAARGAPRFTPPSGWTLVRQDTNGNTMTQATFTHVVGSNEPASYTWTLSSSQSAAGGIIAYDGVRTVSPVDVSGGQANASSTSVTAPSITTSNPGERLIGFFGTGAATTFTAPAGMTERGDIASSAGTYKVTMEVADASWSDAGPTGTRVAKAVNGAANVGQLLALAP
jgi:hypothetical protein